MTQNDINGQIDLFQLVPEEERPAVVETAKTTKAKTVAPAKPKEEPEPDVYDIDRTVFYAGQRVEITDRTMKLEQVREMLEERWPELTKDRCELVYDKEHGHIVPVLKGHKKGMAPLAVVTNRPKEHAQDYRFLDEDGTVYEIRRTQTGIFAAPIQGAGQNHKEFNELFVPRIPLCAIEEVLNTFKKDVSVEHLAYVIWSAYSGYRVHWPKQKKTKVSVEGEPFMETENEFIVLHIHSHNTMPAFFSATDNADEIRSGYYAVVGHCDRELPDLRMRYSCGGHFVDIDPTELLSANLSEVVNVLWK